jgi:hypothetical protein
MNQNKLILFNCFKTLFSYFSNKNKKNNILSNAIRVDGNCICSLCGKKYSKHPFDYDFLSSECLGNYPYLNILCDGTRVKL